MLCRQLNRALKHGNIEWNTTDEAIIKIQIKWVNILKCWTGTDQLNFPPLVLIYFSLNCYWVLFSVRFDIWRIACPWVIWSINNNNTSERGMHIPKKNTKLKPILFAVECFSKTNLSSPFLGKFIFCWTQQKRHTVRKNFISVLHRSSSINCPPANQRFVSGEVPLACLNIIILELCECFHIQIFT